MSIKSWENFYKDASKFTKPAKASKIISEKDIKEVNFLIISVLIGFLSKEDIHVGLKIYIDNELRNDYVEKMVAIRQEQKLH